MDVRLDPITADNVSAVFNLEVAPGQDRFVASNAWSLAEALASGDRAWPRAIVAGSTVDDSTVVGFVMVEIEPDDGDGTSTNAPDDCSYSVWRLMIGADFQRRGYGSAAIGLVVDEVTSRGADELFTSWVPGEGSPEAFYLGLGFEPTGEMDDDEIVGRLALGAG